MTFVILFFVILQMIAAEATAALTPMHLQIAFG